MLVIVSHTSYYIRRLVHDWISYGSSYSAGYERQKINLRLAPAKVTGRVCWYQRVETNRQPLSIA